MRTKKSARADEVVRELMEVLASIQENLGKQAELFDSMAATAESMAGTAPAMIRELREFRDTGGGIHEP